MSHWIYLGGMLLPEGQRKGAVLFLLRKDQLRRVRLIGENGRTPSIVTLQLNPRDEKRKSDRLTIHLQHSFFLS